MDIKTRPAALRVLVVDDSTVIRRLVAIVLERMGLVADFVENGSDALDMLKHTNYDLVFLDVVMPGLDGYQVCKRIKGDRSTKDIPVIMLSSKDGTFDKIRGKMAGANHYLTKPVNMSEFSNVVKQFLPLYNFNAEAQGAKPKQAAHPAGARQVHASGSANKVTTPEQLRNNTELSPAEKIVELRKMMAE